MSEGQVYGARMNPAKIVERGDYNSPDYFLDWAFEEVQRIMVNRKETTSSSPAPPSMSACRRWPSSRSQQTLEAIWPLPQVRPGRLGLDGD